MVSSVPGSTPPRWLHLLVGPNGAGKSTLHSALVQTGVLGTALEFVNADVYERESLQHIRDPQDRSRAAQAWAQSRRSTLMFEGSSLVSETVFSHPSKLDLIDEAHRAGFTVALYVVALHDPQKLLARVAQRVREGGHAVPHDRILARYPRTMALLAQALQLADATYLFDAQEVSAGGPRLVALHTRTGTTVLSAPLPPWAQKMLGGCV